MEFHEMKSKEASKEVYTEIADKLMDSIRNLGVPKRLIFSCLRKSFYFFASFSPASIFATENFIINHPEKNQKTPIINAVIGSLIEPLLPNKSRAIAVKIIPKNSNALPIE